MTGDKAMTATPIHDSSVETFSGALTRQAPTKRSSLARLCDDAIAPPPRLEPPAAAPASVAQLGQFEKTFQKLDWKKIVKTTQYSYACNSLTDFEHGQDMR